MEPNSSGYMFLIIFPAIRHNDKRPIPQGNIAKAKVGKIIDVWNPHYFYTEFGREITYRHIQVLMFCRESGRGTGQIFWRPSNRWTFCWSQPSAGEGAPLSTSSTRLSRDRNQRSCEFQTALGAWIFLFLLVFSSLESWCKPSWLLQAFWLRQGRLTTVVLRMTFKMVV